MRSYCWYRKATEISLGFGYWCCTSVFFMAWKVIIASHFTQNKAGWLNFEQSTRCWCRSKAFLLFSMTSLTRSRTASVLPDACFRDALYNKKSPALPASQCSPFSYICQPLLWAHPTFPVKQRLEPVSKSKLSSHPCRTELQGDLLAPRAPYPLPVSQVSWRFSTAVLLTGPRARGCPLTPFSPSYWGKQAARTRLLVSAPVPTQPSTGSACPRGTARLLHHRILKVKTLPWSQSTSIPACLTPHPANTLIAGVLCLSRWARHETERTCYFSQLTSRYPGYSQYHTTFESCSEAEDIGLGEPSVI